MSAFICRRVSSLENQVLLKNKKETFAVKWMIYTPYTACLKKTFKEFYEKLDVDFQNLYIYKIINSIISCTYIHIKWYSKKVTGSSIFAKLLVAYKKDVKILIFAYYLGKTDYFVHRFYLSQAKTQN